MRMLMFILALAAVAGAAKAGGNVTGKWTGSFNITRGNGDSNDSTAVLILKQTGTEIAGTVGPNEQEQFAIRSGKIDGDKITLEVDHGGHAVKFDLVLTADRITGEATMSGGDGETAKAKLDVARAQ